MGYYPRKPGSLKEALHLAINTLGLPLVSELTNRAEPTVYGWTQESQPEAMPNMHQMCQIDREFERLHGWMPLEAAVKQWHSKFSGKSEPGSEDIVDMLVLRILSGGGRLSDALLNGRAPESEKGEKLSLPELRAIYKRNQNLMRSSKALEGHLTRLMGCDT